MTFKNSVKLLLHFKKTHQKYLCMLCMYWKCAYLEKKFWIKNFLQPGPLTLVIRWQERAKSGLLITDRKWQLIEERYNIISGGSFKMHRSFFLSFKLAMMAPLPDRWRHHLSIDDILLSLKLLNNVVLNLFPKFENFLNQYFRLYYMNEFWIVSEFQIPVLTVLLPG